MNENDDDFEALVEALAEVLGEIPAHRMPSSTGDEDDWDLPPFRA